VRGGDGMTAEAAECAQLSELHRMIRATATRAAAGQRMA
jgi:hypothetical protein